MSTLVGKLRWSMRHRGVGGTVSAAAHWLRRTMVRVPVAALHPFDMAHGTDTGGLIAGSNLAAGHANDAHIAGYAAVPPSRLRGMIARWQASGPPHTFEEYCFVDLGCGKGRALLLASEMGFREVVGVELNPALAAVARDNVDIWSAAGKGRVPISVVQKDALEMEWATGPCLVFLFNPFDVVLMRRMMERMGAAFRGRQSELEVLSYKPNSDFAAPVEFELIWREAIGIDAEELAVDPVADEKDETVAYRLRVGWT